MALEPLDKPTYRNGIVMIKLALWYIFRMFHVSVEIAGGITE